MDLPVTFRAAGTSLSGQAITDSILLVAGKMKRNIFRPGIYAKTHYSTFLTRRTG